MPLRAGDACQRRAAQQRYGRSVAGGQLACQAARSASDSSPLRRRCPVNTASEIVAAGEGGGDASTGRQVAAISSSRLGRASAKCGYRRSTRRVPVADRPGIGRGIPGRPGPASRSRTGPTPDFEVANSRPVVLAEGHIHRSLGQRPRNERPPTRPFG